LAVVNVKSLLDVTLLSFLIHSRVHVLPGINIEQEVASIALLDSNLILAWFGRVRDIVQLKRETFFKNRLSLSVFPCDLHWDDEFGLKSSELPLDFVNEAPSVDLNHNPVDIKVSLVNPHPLDC
jgi:hypothetical protein